jgi:phenylacetate-coenzyme A ligase PaaK-like adenylate-forming protein
MNPRLLLSPKIRHDFRAAQARIAGAAASENVDWSQYQLKAVQSNWQDAIADIPYYSGLVNSGQAAPDIRSFKDLQSLPVLTRQILQDRAAEFVRRSGPPDSYSMTAGSTGNPIRFGMNQSCRDLMRIVKLSAWMQFGYTPSSRLFLIWGHSHLLGTGLKGKANHLKRKLSDALLGYERVDAYRLNRELCIKYAERLLRFRPLGIVGYASALQLFGHHTRHLRKQFRAMGVRFVLATAEPPPNPECIPFLEDLFGCPVVQEYGGAEFGQVAFKIGAAPFEVYPDLNYVECEPPLIGELDARPALVTTLYPRYFPLFRYRVGDAFVGVEQLDHGHVRRFSGVAGRLNDIVNFDDGTSIHSVAIFHCIHQERSVHSIQMVVADDGISILLAGDSDGDAKVESRVRERLIQVHPPLGLAQIKFVEDIVTNRAGKRRWFVDRRSKAPVTQ